MGSILFSLDAELAWGFNDQVELAENRIKCARDSWIKILELFDRFDIKATWAIVGHLFLNECDGLHKNHPGGKKWFQNDPGGSIKEFGNWYGTDLIEKIIKSKNRHEIACHSFSHPEFNSIDTNFAEAELQCSIEAAKKMDITFESFIFPRNKINYLFLLKKYGFKSYRGLEPFCWYEKISFNKEKQLNHLMKKTGKLVDFYLIRTPPPIIHPLIDDYGLVNIPASFFVFMFEGKVMDIGEKLSFDPVLLKIKKGIDIISNTNGILHLWFHPNNLQKQRDFTRLKNIVSYIKQTQKSSLLKINTMSEIAQEVLEKKRNLN